MYPLTSCERKKLKKALRAVYTIPFIDDVEDFIWEAIFCYVKDIPLADPLTNIRKKRLFDIVDSSASIGWSAKALQKEVRPHCKFEWVIQRADIFTKSQELGFNSLSVASPTRDLGLALWRHWYGKVDGDAKEQSVTDKSVCILVKSKDRKTLCLPRKRSVRLQTRCARVAMDNENKNGASRHSKKGWILCFPMVSQSKTIF